MKTKVVQHVSRIKLDNWTTGQLDNWTTGQLYWFPAKNLVIDHCLYVEKKTAEVFECINSHGEMDPRPHIPVEDVNNIWKIDISFSEASRNELKPVSLRIL